jgi:hypothetical protein
MVKLQRHKARIYKAESGKETEHYKHIIALPESAISELRRYEGQESTWSINENALTLQPEPRIRRRVNDKK